MSGAGIKLEVGKAYRTRSGDKAVIEQKLVDDFCFVGTIDGHQESWTRGGSADLFDETANDLVAVWEDGDAQRRVRIKLDLSEIYKNALGEHVRIVVRHHNRHAPDGVIDWFEGDDGFIYLEDGTCQVRPERSLIEKWSIPENKFTIGSQWRTRGGWRAVVVGTENNFGSNLLVWHEKLDATQGHWPKGEASLSAPDVCDLISPWSEPRRVRIKGYVNVFSNGDVLWWANRRLADEFANGRIACIVVERDVEFGEGLTPGGA